MCSEAEIARPLDDAGLPRHLGNNRQSLQHGHGHRKLVHVKRLVFTAVIPHPALAVVATGPVAVVHLVPRG
jgi:hypothetical protein